MGKDLEDRVSEYFKTYRNCVVIYRKIKVALRELHKIGSKLEVTLKPEFDRVHGELSKLVKDTKFEKDWENTLDKYTSRANIIQEDLRELLTKVRKGKGKVEDKVANSYFNRYSHCIDLYQELGVALSKLYKDNPELAVKIRVDFDKMSNRLGRLSSDSMCEMDWENNLDKYIKRINNINAKLRKLIKIANN